MKVNFLDGLMSLGWLRPRIGNIHANDGGEIRYELMSTLTSLALSKMM